MTKFKFKEFIDDFYPEDAKNLGYFGIFNIFGLLVVSEFIFPHLESEFLKQIITGALNPLLLNFGLGAALTIIGFSENKAKILQRILIAIPFIAIFTIFLDGGNLDFIGLDSLPKMPDGFLPQFFMFLPGAALGVAECFILLAISKER